MLRLTLDCNLDLELGLLRNDVIVLNFFGPSSLTLTLRFFIVKLSFL